MKLKHIAAMLLLGLCTKAGAQQLDPAKDPRIDPEVRTYLKDLNEASKGKTPIYKLPGNGPAEALTALQHQTQVDLSGIEVTDRTIIQDGITVPVHIVRPAGVTGTLPVIVFYHGGVWLVGNFENHKRFVRDLVVGTKAVVVFPDYTPIPQAKYPTQVNQGYATLKWVAAHGAEISVDPSRLAIAGNSVGGNMTAAISLMAKDKQGPDIKLAVLFYPAVGVDFNTNSYKEFANGRFLTRDFMMYGWNIYAPDAATRRDRYCVPMEATLDQLKGVCPTLIQTAENCPLRDEGEAYGRKLREAGVQATTVRYLGVIHDFGLLNGINKVPAVQQSIKDAVEALTKALQ